MNTSITLRFLFTLPLLAAILSCASTPPPVAVMEYDSPAYDQPLLVRNTATGDTYTPNEMTRSEVFSSFGVPRAVFYGQINYDVTVADADAYHIYKGISFYIVGEVVEGITILSQEFELTNGMTVDVPFADIEAILGTADLITETETKDFITYSIFAGGVNCVLGFEVGKD